MTSYSNPRRHAEIDNWPMGGSKRGIAIFDIEAKPGRGERGVRVTRDPAGRAGAPKLLTFARKARIVDGDDGRTYIAELTIYGFISIMRGDMKYIHESVNADDPRHEAMVRLFEEAAA